MKTLSPEAYDRAVSFLTTKGRPLDQALFAHHFDTGPVDAILNALAAFQNQDGGFGHGLEPDIQMPESSARATTFGLETLIDVKAPAHHPVIRSAMAYLLATFDTSSQVWPIVPPDVDNAPHAPWWDYAGTEKGFRSFHLNPTAEALAYLYAYPADIPDDLRASLTATVLDRADASPDAMEMHDMQCCIRLADTNAFPTDARDRLVEKLKTAAEVEVVRDPGKWGGYTTKPLNVVLGPNSCLASQFESDLSANLDFEIDQQGEDGSWSPPWSWGAYEDDWPAAKLAWQSYLTITTLTTLKGFGRIESA